MSREAYRGPSLTCPVCEVPLEEIPAPLPVYGCTNCGGAWLGPEAAVHLLRDEEDAVTHGVIVASQRIPHDERVQKPHAEEDGRVCAMCSQPMSTIRVGKIRLETCPHGTWFDRDEVRKAFHVLDLKRRGLFEEHDLFIDVLARIERWLFKDDS